MAQVIKKDGSKEEFSETKLKNSISGAADDAKLSAKKKKALVEKVLQATKKIVAKRKSIETQTIREFIIKQLLLLDPESAKAWVGFEYQKENQEEYGK